MKLTTNRSLDKRALPTMSSCMSSLQDQVKACEICKDRFAATKTAHAPRPIVWFQADAKILIAGQAPGARVQASGVPFDDPSGDRLRDWMGVDRDVFYDQSRVAVLPMAFCFPGYDAKGSDLPPPKICAATWRDKAMNDLGQMPLVLLVGGYAQNWHLGGKLGVTERVLGWQQHAPHVFPLPHPSWRNTGWIKKNPWFSDELLPALKARVKDVLI